MRAGREVVAPLVGAWIEILPYVRLLRKFQVAPLVGAWIEILAQIKRELPKVVAPLVGAWIEMQMDY